MLKYSKIISAGSYLPKKVLTNDDLSKIVDTSDEWITTRTGIKQRHIAEENQTTSDLAVEACKDALAKASLTIDDIDCIVCATATPDLTFPSTATIIQKKLNMKKGFAFDVQAVCSGFIYGLSVVDSLISTNKAKRALLVGAETFSRILNWEDRNTCVLFGDGAGAVVIEQTEEKPSLQAQGVLGIEIFSDGNYCSSLQTTGGPSYNQEVGYITMKGQEVFKHAVTNLANVIDVITEKCNISYNDINWLVPHQANVRIINAMGNKIGLDSSKVVVTIQNHGNTSAASIPLALCEAITDGRIKKNDIVLMEAMGGGFTWGAALVKM